MQTIEWLLLVVVVVVVREGECQMSLNEYTYKNLGRDWPGTCVAGSMQSPINIANKFNTEIDEDSVVDFDYFLTPDFAARKEKFYYDGRDLELKAKIGNLKFFHLDGSQETYQAEKISIKYPSEHIVTNNGQSVRQSMEMQIEHSFIHSTNPKLTFQRMQVQKAIVSILFKDVSFFEFGDDFLTKMSIDGYFVMPDGSAQVLLPHHFLDSEQKLHGGVEYGLDYTALEFLMNLLNSSTHMYMYYGSETRPPCMENIKWLVFKQVRSMSRPQMEYIKAQLMKERSGNEANAIKNFYGNSRGLQYYDDFRYGNIKSMVQSITRIRNIPNPKVSVV